MSVNRLSTKSREIPDQVGDDEGGRGMTSRRGRGDRGGCKRIPVILSPYRYAPGFQNDSGDDKRVRGDDRGMGKETHGFGGEDYSASLTQRTKLNSFLRE